jgi:hypothetical protein
MKALKLLSRGLVMLFTFPLILLAHAVLAVFLPIIAIIIALTDYAYSGEWEFNWVYLDWG